MCVSIIELASRDRRTLVWSSALEGLRCCHVFGMISQVCGMFAQALGAIARLEIDVWRDQNRPPEGPKSILRGPTPSQDQLLGGPAESGASTNGPRAPQERPRTRLRGPKRAPRGASWRPSGSQRRPMEPPKAAQQDLGTQFCALKL